MNLYQFELKDVSAVLSFGTSLNGGVLVAQKRIFHGEDSMKSRENWIDEIVRSGLRLGYERALGESRTWLLLRSIYSEGEKRYAF